MELSECFRKNFIKKTEINKEQINSLKEISKQQEQAAKELSNKKEYSSITICLAYDSLRTILESICILHKYNVLNHICLGLLLKKIDPEFNTELFNYLRQTRNLINYYGNNISSKQSKIIISQTFKLKKELINKHIKN